MVVYSFHIFDRHTECVYSKSWLPSSAGSETAAPTTSADDAKLLFGTVFSLRNMVRKLGGDDDAFISYRTAQYKLHFYETPANLRFVILTDTATLSMRNVLHQIYINLWVEYVVKNPLAPVEHKKGEGVKNELFELGLDQFIRGLISREAICLVSEYLRTRDHAQVFEAGNSDAISYNEEEPHALGITTTFPGVKKRNDSVYCC